jgi:hypothetical protein
VADWVLVKEVVPACPYRFRPMAALEWKLVGNLGRQSDSTNEMGWGIGGGRVGTKRHPCRIVPKTAFLGGFSLVVLHFISEMSDFLQQYPTSFHFRAATGQNQ